MPTSGTTTYTMTALEVIEKAFHRLGKASEGESLSARMADDGKSSLNLILKDLQAEIHLWTQTDGTIALVAAQAGYTLSSTTPLRILSARLRDTDSRDTPLSELSRQEYFELPNKTDPDGVPVSFYYDPQRAAGVLYLWPAPDTNAVADYDLYVSYLRRIEDISSTSDSLDIPQEWLQGIIWALADDLETEYPVNDARLAGKIERKAGEFMNKMRAWDTELTSIYIQPDLG